MNLTDLEPDELDTDELWQLALKNHPGCLLEFGWYACKAMGWELPHECPICTKPIPGEPPN